jgi:hypothetical protein
MTIHLVHMHLHEDVALSVFLEAVPQSLSSQTSKQCFLVNMNLDKPQSNPANQGR